MDLERWSDAKSLTPHWHIGLGSLGCWEDHRLHELLFCKQKKLVLKVSSSPWSLRPRCQKARVGFSWCISAWLGTITFLVCLLMACPLCVFTFLRFLPVLIRPPIVLDQGSTLVTSFNLRRQRKKVKSASHVWLFATLWDVGCQAPPSMGFSRQEY